MRQGERQARSQTDASENCPRRPFSLALQSSTVKLATAARQTSLPSTWPPPAAFSQFRPASLGKTEQQPHLQPRRRPGRKANQATEMRSFRNHGTTYEGLNTPGRDPALGLVPKREGRDGCLQSATYRSSCSPRFQLTCDDFSGSGLFSIPPGLVKTQLPNGQLGTEYQVTVNGGVKTERVALAADTQSPPD